MSKIMLVNVTHVEESRVAVLDNGVLEAYEIETINRTQIQGNIYNAVVENVHPTLEAAFLKISSDLKGFLPLDEVNFNLLPSRSDSRKSGRIGKHLRPGQKIMAQVVREPFAGKPPTVSTYFSLPGRYLVLMPGVDSAGISRKIEGSDQRERLKKIVGELRAPEGFGLIVRTAGMGQTKLELQRDLRYLLRLWQSIQRASQATEFPGLVYREADLVIRTIRDHLSSDISEVWIDSQETYDEALEFVRAVMPNRAKTLRLYTGNRPLFNKYNLEEQIESIYKRRVPLPSGGEIVIDGTEALTAIDVNSARSKRKGDAEETTLQTNLEAAPEIARQLRLRDLGGLIVVDFIDMAGPKNKKKVEEKIREAMRGDKAKHDITRISKMGLVEIARQRLKGAKMGAMYTACPTCEGYGLIKNLEAAALAALRKVQTRSARGDCGRIRLALPTEVATWMLNHKREDLVRIESRQNLRIDIEPRDDLLRHEAELEIFAREKAEEPAARVVGDRMIPPLPPTEQEMERVDAGSDTKPVEEPEEAPTEAAEPKPPRKRRRRRRRAAGGAAADADAAQAAPDEATAPAEPAPVEQPAGKGKEEETKILPFTPAAAAETPDGAEAAAEAEATETAGERPRRRRRRRRRGRGSSEERAAGTESTSKPPEPQKPASDEGLVPVGIRSDELMPAAAAGSRRKKGGRRPAKRKRRSSVGPLRIHPADDQDDD